MQKILQNMDVQKEDMASVIITLCLLATWYITLLLYNHPLLSLLILWVGMILLSIIYTIIYWKKKRDWRIFKIRFLVSVVPIYSTLLFYVYVLLYGKDIPGFVRYLPIGIIGTMLLLNAGVVYWFSRHKKTTPL
jgi:multisubunit Na+/H+ antiporter MnhB subunit